MRQLRHIATNSGGNCGWPKILYQGCEEDVGGIGRLIHPLRIGD